MMIDVESWRVSDTLARFEYILNIDCRQVLEEDRTFASLGLNMTL